MPGCKRKEIMHSEYREQIHAARELLWKEYEQFLITVLKKTRRPQVPYDKETARPFADDISQWVSMIANAPKDSSFCQFYAPDLTQVPPCRPEEVNIFSLVSRISALEKNDRDRRSMENIKPQRLQPSHPISEYQPHTDQQTNVRIPVPVTVSSAPPEETWAKVVDRNKKRIQKVTARKEVRAAAKDLHVVVGTAGAKDVKACPPLKHIFVYKVSRDCTADSIRTLMKSNGVDPINIRITSKPSWLSSSFCISIAKDDFSKTFSEGFWPSEPQWPDMAIRTYSHFMIVMAIRTYSHFMIVMAIRTYSHFMVVIQIQNLLV
ncbi:hypothetical protein CAPTEDRAFT_195143 [Capitella teleta]|uniref:Uncharacterized protein n=1 Tax=Capitella teleta TaxID=283909 RepID=R7VEB0_CAPTE|nr:hypothetical protein CAPTEDRAFT_195143 [Capitella teleta]|eukprot:ELU16912.1 hypothetical protein CAPTEDRAFT_195143 [Capitella teleta]